MLLVSLLLIGNEKVFTQNFTAYNNCVVARSWVVNVALFFLTFFLFSGKGWFTLAMAYLQLDWYGFFRLGRYRDSVQGRI